MLIQIPFLPSGNGFLTPTVKGRLQEEMCENKHAAKDCDEAGRAWKRVICALR